MCACLQVREDVYECSYSPSEADSLSVSVQYGGENVAQSPYQVNFGPVSQCMMRTYGAGLVDGVAGFPATFTVQTNNEQGTLGLSRSPCLSVSLFLCVSPCLSLVFLSCHVAFIVKLAHLPIQLGIILIV